MPIVYSWGTREESSGGEDKECPQSPKQTLVGKSGGQPRLQRKEQRCSEFFQGMPHCLDAGNLKELNANLHYSVAEVSQKFHLLFP